MRHQAPLSYLTHGNPNLRMRQTKAKQAAAVLQAQIERAKKARAQEKVLRARAAQDIHEMQTMAGVEHHQHGFQDIGGAMNTTTAGIGAAAAVRNFPSPLTHCLVFRQARQEMRETNP